MWDFVCVPQQFLIERNTTTTTVPYECVIQPCALTSSPLCLGQHVIEHTTTRVHKSFHHYVPHAAYTFVKRLEDSSCTLYMGSFGSYLWHYLLRLGISSQKVNLLSRVSNCCRNVLKWSINIASNLKKKKN